MNELNNGFGALPNGFSAAPAEELSQIEGGSWLSKAWNWISNHIGVSGHDMSGNSAVVVSVKGTF